MVDSIIERLQPIADEKGLRLINDLPSGLPKVQSDEFRVFQIVQNIIGNAVKFTEKGKVIVRAAFDDRDISLIISDTGIGIAKEELSHIFDEFRQVDGSTSRPYGGTGLGLAIAKKSIKLLGGDISVQSEMGKGSTFTLKFPLKYEITATKPDISLPRPSVDRKTERTVGNKILLVDDNETALLQVKSMLEREGFTVDVARDGKEALLSLAHTIPDGIVLDLMMPEMDGFEVVDNLRNNRTTAGIPILILTAKDLDPDELRKLRSNNIKQLIQKGNVDKKELIKNVKVMLGDGSKSAYDSRDEIKVERDLKSKKIRAARRGSKKVKPKILLVEDDNDNRLTIKSILQDRYQVMEAADGEEGLKKTTEDLPDLVILDISLPKMDGLTVAKKIKAQKKTNDIPVIAFTAHAMEGDKERILAAGCDDYLSKPAGVKEILRKIEKWL